jgi:hypothetical protein
MAPLSGFSCLRFGSPSPTAGSWRVRDGSAMRRIARVLAVAAIALLAAPATPRAAVIAATPSLPLLGVPYISATAAGCFPTAGVCVGGGAVTMTSLISSSFDASGQHILTNATYVGTLTSLIGAPIGLVMLAGTVAQDVLGRASDSETGIWTTQLASVSLTGSVLGQTLLLELAGSPPSVGETSITAIAGATNDETLYRIDSFFDIFVELTLDTVPPLTAIRGPLTITATAVPEPAGIALLSVALLGLGAAGWARKDRRTRRAGEVA